MLEKKSLIYKWIKWIVRVNLCNCYLVRLCKNFYNLSKLRYVQLLLYKNVDRFESIFYNFQFGDDRKS